MRIDEQLQNLIDYGFARLSEGEATNLKLDLEDVIQDVKKLQSALTECKKERDEQHNRCEAKLLSYKAVMEQMENELKLNADAVVAQGKIIDECVRALTYVLFSLHPETCGKEEKLLIEQALKQAKGEK